MSKPTAYYLPSTKLIPNSRFPLLHYTRILAHITDCQAVQAYELFLSNGWRVQWMGRYPPSQRSHYHSKTHECMAVLHGSATIRFGVADTSPDLEQNTHGPAKEHGGIELRAEVGDVFVIPAGVAHKTFDPSPTAEGKMLTPGDGHGIAADDPKAALQDIELSGFIMIGAYPEGGVWDHAHGGEHVDSVAEVWSVPKPAKDPVRGANEDGLCGMW